MSDSPDPTAPAGPTPGQINAATIIFAIFALFSGGVLMFALDTDAEGWARILVIFSTFEALGFAAAGLLLGERGNARNAADLTRTRQRNTALEHRMQSVRAEAIEVAETTRANLDAALCLLDADAPAIESGGALQRDGALALLREAKATAETLGRKMRVPAQRTDAPRT